MATMNPVSLYHDPALDGLVEQPSRPRQGGSVKRRGVEQSYGPPPETYTTNLNGQSPYASATHMQGPPISYRGNGGNTEPGLQRSFSQRAKGRPFAEEAFADDDVEDMRIGDVSRTVQGSIPADHHNQQPVRSTSQHEAPPPVRMPQANIQQQRRENYTAPGTQGKQRSSAVQESQPQTPNSKAVFNRAATLRDASNQTDEDRQDWAHDRSPLQKLEIKLTDISKEEKRARVQEAEMKLMRDRNLPIRGEIRGQARKDSQAERGASRSQAADPIRTPKVRTEPVVQTRSDDARSQRPQPLPYEIPKPAVKYTSEEGGSERKQNREAGPTNSPRVLSGTQRGLPPGETRSRGAVRSASAKQPPVKRPEVDVSQPQVARAVSLTQRNPASRSRADDQPLSERDRNASHQAALEQLTGTTTRTSKPGSRKAQDVPLQSSDGTQRTRSEARRSSPVPIDLSSIGGGEPKVGFPQQANAKEIQVRQPQPQREQQNYGLGLQHPKALRSLDSPPVSLTDASKQRQRKSSVSFKEPFERRRPVDEWKQADTARLMLHDFSSDKADATEANKAWWEQDKKAQRSSRTRTVSGSALPNQQIDDRTAQFNPRLYIKCGPLLRYTGMKRTKDESQGGSATKEFWRGSVMIVTQDSQCDYEEMPTLRLFSQPRKLLPPPPSHVTAEDLAPEYVDPIAGLIKLGRTGRARYVRPVDHLDEEKDLSRIEDDNGIYEAAPSPLDVNGSKDATTASNNKRTLEVDGEHLGRFREVRGVRIYADPDRDVTFWRFNLEIELGLAEQHVAYRINKGAAVGFWVPAKGQTMNMMFHTCNGFSLSVNPDQFSGPDPLWRDVLNTHQTRPFHVMIGGGDQIYNDRVMTETQHFADWTAIRNPHHKHQAPFTNEMREELESFYLERYSMWFSQGLFAMANASIPMVNVWDDHDIIDGFGSYPHEFMRTPVFSGLGNIAYKYYMLFQHQSIDSMTEKDEPSWLLGHAPGPYIKARSRSLYMELGQSVAFLGIDCRTERTKNDVLSVDTLELILDRCRKDMVEGQTKHLIVLLGIPIAYPRLVWLESVLTSRAMDPIKALGRAGILKTKLLNKFDGGVEILDDLDDHWTASHHKDERNILIQELQDLAAEKSARVTFLGGDVHLAAIGQFYSNPKLKIPKDKDHRYMPNVISSAIVNTPPPEFMADVINKRNKVHHLDKYTDENMIPMFTHDVDHKKRNNNHLLPRRNWCSIREYKPGQTPPPSPPSTPSIVDEEEGSMPVEHEEEEWYLNNPPKRRLSLTKTDFNPRNLMRRLSSRGQVPPTSFRPGTGPNPLQQPRASSFDGNDRSHVQQDNMERSSSFRASSADNLDNGQALRPIFHRRPTNLSEKAAKKGNMPAVDADGNEFDINDHVNLEGGLDVSINCEINQKDPAGITTSYRILVPALWYDGRSDREKFTEGAPVGRRNTVLQRFGIGSKRGHNAADNQGAGNWGQEMSETESYNGSEEAEQKPRRTFSLFGNRRRKGQAVEDGYQRPSGTQVPNGQSQLRSENAGAFVPARQQNYNAPYDSNTNRNPSVERKPAQQQTLMPSHGSQQSNDHPASGQVSAENNVRITSGSQRGNRPNSYTIGGNTPEIGRASSPYDADAAYVHHQHQNQQQPSQRSPPRDLGYFPQPQLHQSQSQPESSSLQRTPSKQERILGIGSAADAGFRHNNPPQTQLRGNGLLGRIMSGSSRTAPSAYRNDSYNSNNSQGHSQSEDENSPRGYSGIEAYKEPKSRRRWSLSIREKARGLINSVEGKRRDDRDDWYSDDEEEEYWEGPKTQGQQGLENPGFDGRSGHQPGHNYPQGPDEAMQHQRRY